MANITELIKKIRSAILGKDVRESIAGAIEQCYEDAIKSGNANMEVAEARGTFNTLNQRLNNSDSLRENTDSSLQSQINSLASGSPLVADSIEEMTDTSRVYVNTTNGHWYTFNGTTWIDGGVYQGVVLPNNSVDFVNIEENFSRFLDYKKISVTLNDGHFINWEKRTIEDNNSYVYTEPIELKKGETIQMLADIKGPTLSAITRVNLNGTIENMLVRAENGLKIYTYTANENMYVSLSYLKSGFKYFSISKLINKLYNNLNETSFITNLKPKLNFGGFIGYKENTILSTQYYAYTEPIKLLKNQTIKVKESIVGSDVSVITIVDSELNIIQTLMENINSEEEEEYYYTATEDCYVSISMNISKNSEISLYYDLKKLFNLKINDYTNYSQFLLKNSSYLAAFKKIGFIGDSLTAGAVNYKENNELKSITYEDISYPKKLSQILNNDYEIFAMGGYTTRLWLNHFSTSILAENNKCEAYFIGLGVNDDGNENFYVGSYEDINNNSDDVNFSFYGNYGKIINLLKQAQPKCKIFCITDPRENKFNDTIREIVTKFDNCYLIDLNKHCNWYDNNDFVSKYFTGKAHMNSLGYLYTAWLINYFANDIIKNNIEDFNELQFIGTDYQYL